MLVYCINHKIKLLNNIFWEKNNGKSKAIKAYDKNGVLVYQFDSLADASRFFTKKLNNGSNAMAKEQFICSALKGRKKTAYGLKWEYA